MLKITPEAGKASIERLQRFRTNSLEYHQASLNQPRKPDTETIKFIDGSKVTVKLRD